MTGTRSSGPSPRSALLRTLAKLLLSALLAAACVWVMHRGALRLTPDPKAFARVDARWVGLYVLLWFAAQCLRAGRWQLLLAPAARVKLWTVLRVAWIGFAAVVILPLRMGEVVRPLLIRRASPISGWVATGTVAAERVIDGLFLSSILFIALTFSHPLDPLPDRIGELAVPTALVPRAAYSALCLFAIAFSVMAFAYFARSLTQRLISSAVGAVSPRLAEFVSKRLAELTSGLSFLQNPRFTVPFLGMTAAYWFLSAASFMAMATACALPTMSFAQGCVVLGVLGLGVLVPNAPGFFGAFQLSVYAGLALFYPPDSVLGAGSAYVFLMYLGNVGLPLVLGVLALLFEPTRLRELEPAEVAATTNLSN